MDNTALWKKVFMTDPRAVKPITGKQYQGNSPKPYWIVQRLTEEFGPCGIGWGFSILNERFERFSETDTLHVAVVRLWFEHEGKRGELEQVGQTKASYTTGAGKFMLDEDAPKKSVTDALVKCASYLGFAGDIFSGRWDDSKYVAEALKAYKDAEQPAPEKKRTGVAQDVLDTTPALPPETTEQLDHLARIVKEDFDAYGAQAAFERIDAEKLDNVEKIYLSTKLDSTTRNKIKAYSIAFHSTKPNSTWRAGA